MLPPTPPIEPIFDGACVPVVFATDDNYAPYLSVALQSLLSHTSAARRYDIIVLQDGLSTEYSELLQKQCAAYPNVSLRYYDVPSELQNYDFQLNLLPIATYYRLCAPGIFAKYEKVLYLDVDICVLSDVAELYDTELGEYMVGACRDYGMMQMVYEQPKHGIYKYLTQTLGMKETSDYVNAGVLLLNIGACREQDFTQKMLDVTLRHKTLFGDQDMLNEVCQGKILHMDPAWNSAFLLEEKCVPAALYEAHKRSIQEPKILHYMGLKGLKPWNTTKYATAGTWWQYAAQSPFIGEILNRRFQQIEKQFDETTKKLATFHLRSLWKRRYRRYKLLSRITFGATRKRYKQLRRQWHEVVRQIRIWEKQEREVKPWD